MGRFVYVFKASICGRFTNEKHDFFMIFLRFCFVSLFNFIIKNFFSMRSSNVFYHRCWKKNCFFLIRFMANGGSKGRYFSNLYGGLIGMLLDGFLLENSSDWIWTGFYSGWKYDWYKKGVILTWWNQTKWKFLIRISKKEQNGLEIGKLTCWRGHVKWTLILDEDIIIIFVDWMIEDSNNT